MGSERPDVALNRIVAMQTEDIRKERDALQKRVAALEAWITNRGMREHYSCEDCWYSCPKSVDGCCNEGEGTECNCGAEKHNAEARALLEAKP